MNYETVNIDVLAAIALLALIFYVAVVWLGWGEINAHINRRAVMGKRGSNHSSVVRRRRKAKKST